MLSLQTPGTRLCDGLTRREWLRIGGLTLAGLSLPSLLQARDSAVPSPGGSFGKAKACIFLFHLGGPPQHETWDPKPDAPAEIRGEFKPIASSLPGLQVGELMPKTASLAHLLCVHRALATDDNAHSSSGYWMLTGVPHQPLQTENAKPGAPNDWPCLAALVQRLRAARGGLPASIALPDHIWNDGNLSWPGQDGGFLGRSADPWLLHCDPNAAEFQIPGLALPDAVPPVRFDDRLSLLQQVNQRLDAVERSDAIARFDNRTQQAFDLLRGGKARRAFDIHQEPAAVRDRFGRTRWGQSVLLARRLVEAGVSLVQVNWTRMAEEQGGSPVWDTHANHAKNIKRLMPIMDQAYSALLEDLQQRGLLDETLVVWCGEFGRTPKINGARGRDHWGHVFSAALAGGGVRGGQVIGSSDKIGGRPREGRVAPQDVQATILHCLGYPAHTEVRDTLARPVPVTRGEVIRAMVG